MQFRKTFTAASLASCAFAAYVPSDPWTTLTPDSTYKGGLTDYASTFGIAVIPITTSVSTKTSATATSTSTPKAKRDVAAISQIGDGQIQATTKTLKPSPKTTAAAVSQIGDGQIQATAATSIPPVHQICDGQIQATTAKPEAPPAVSQIGDGQIQATAAPAVSQIGDGQIQATATTSDAAPAQTRSATKEDPVKAQSCKNSGTLQMTLKDAVLTDGNGRLGSIVSSRQFQFDGPPPQAGAIYAKGWALTPEGNLALGDSDVFYQCLSGDFYNLYDENVAEQCTPVNLQAIDLVDC